jgi:hypothetical protein
MVIRDAIGLEVEEMAHAKRSKAVCRHTITRVTRVLISQEWRVA